MAANKWYYRNFNNWTSLELGTEINWIITPAWMSFPLGCDWKTILFDRETLKCWNFDSHFRYHQNLGSRTISQRNFDVRWKYANRNFDESLMGMNRHSWMLLLSLRSTVCPGPMLRFCHGTMQPPWYYTFAEWTWYHHSPAGFRRIHELFDFHPPKIKHHNWIINVNRSNVHFSIAIFLMPTFIFSSSISFHLSIETERTKDKCTPRPRCFPEHSRQIHIPYVTETHCGLCVPHSKHFYIKFTHTHEKYSKFIWFSTLGWSSSHQLMHSVSITYRIFIGRPKIL